MKACMSSAEHQGDSSVGQGGPRGGWQAEVCLTRTPCPQMRCCGVTDYTDWYPVLGENMVPDRCCMENSQGCGRNSTTPLWRTVRTLPGEGRWPGAPRNWVNAELGGTQD